MARVASLSLALTVLGVAGMKLMSRNAGVGAELRDLRMGPWMGLGFALTYGLATLVWAQRDLNYGGLVDAGSLKAGATVSACGFVALVVGYLTAPRALRRTGARANALIRGRSSSFHWGVRTVWALFGIGLVGDALRLRSGSLGFLSDPNAALSTTSSFGAAASALSQLGVLSTLVAASRLSATKRSGNLLALITVAGTQTAIGLFSGLKEAAIVQLIAIVIGLSAKRRVNWLAVAGAAAITLLVISPFVSAYRAEVINGSTRLSATEVLENIDFANLARESVAGGGSDHSSPFDRWSRLGDVSIIASQTPWPVAYQSPMVLVAGPLLGVIPRSLWPGKPVLDAGYQVNQIYYHMPASIYSSAAVTPYGDLYRHGGLGVVFVGMLLMGWAVRCLDSVVDARGSGSDPRLLFLPLLLLPTLVKQEVDVLGLTASLPLMVVGALVASRISASGQGHPQRVLTRKES
ncbi:hypothetical protein [Pedococcus sp. 2YAF34]|uniref:hypothetical protein n=1 Tax=Pedococcus sp. 2YAF34 TaxID=3233032 RepID=UPI003F9D36FB